MIISPLVLATSLLLWEASRRQRHWLHFAAATVLEQAQPVQGRSWHYQATYKLGRGKAGDVSWNWILKCCPKTWSTLETVSGFSWLHGYRLGEHVFLVVPKAHWTWISNTSPSIQLYPFSMIAPAMLMLNTCILQYLILFLSRIQYGVRHQGAVDQITQERNG